MPNDIVGVEGAVQHYAWGVKGSGSLVAQIHRHQNPEANIIDEEQRYAELWLGAHPSCPSKLIHLTLPQDTLASNMELQSSPRAPKSEKRDDACVSEPVTAAQTAESTAEVASGAQAVAEPLVSGASSAVPCEPACIAADACSPEAKIVKPPQSATIAAVSAASQEPAPEVGVRHAAGEAGVESTELVAEDEDDETEEDKFEDVIVGGSDEAVAEAPVEQRTPTADAFLSSSARESNALVDPARAETVLSAQVAVKEESPLVGAAPGGESGSDDVATSEVIEKGQVLGERKMLTEATTTMEWLAVHGCEIPYLFKVLSVASPLSLQLHPDLETAKLIHAEDPANYKDPYDKPEMALALSDPFEAFCGFRKMKDITAIAHLVPPFAKLLRSSGGQDGHETNDEAQQLRTLMKNLYRASQEEIEVLIQEVLNLDFDQISSTKSENEKSDKTLLATVVKSMRNIVGKSETSSDNEDLARTTIRLFKRIQLEYPKDRGLFACFFLNYCQLRPGECIALSPRTIHAYIKGDCLECMKSSDNVIRAGLTPKFQDVDKLLALVHYKTLNLANAMIKGLDVPCKFEPSSTKSSLKVIIPTITDTFRFYILRLTPGVKLSNVPIPRWHPLMLFVLRGSGELEYTSASEEVIPLKLVPATTLLMTRWSSLSVRSTVEGDKNMKLGPLRLTAEEMATNSAATGELSIVFIVPNVDSHRIKRSSKDCKKSKSQRTSPSPHHSPNRA